MTRLSIRSCIAAAAAVFVHTPIPSVSAAEKPNIVVILVDDMGFSDVGCYGSEIDTPNIDKLAKNGVRFSQFYNTGRCCPTRASLLTGLYSHQAGIGHMTADYGKRGYRGFLRKDTPTIAEMLKPAGYFTAMTGKWHVGSADGQRPPQRGFDRFYGIPEGGGFYYHIRKNRTVRLGEEIIYDGIEKKTPKGWYTTDAWADYGIKFIDEALEKKKPFFLYLAHNAPHFPLQAPAKTIAKYRGRYKQGWDKLRKARHEKQLASSLFRRPWKLSERDPKVPAWDTLNEKKRDEQDELMAIYAAVMEHLDRSIGRVVDALQKRKVLDNTLILFMSDNGGCAEGGLFGKTGNKGTPGDPDSNVFCGTCWANAQDTPFRYFKHYVHEGGISTPLIAHWPKGIKQPGRTDGSMGHVIDIMATCCDVAGVKPPKTEGQSLVPEIRSGERMKNPRGPLFWEHEGNRAVRFGGWKLVAVHNKPWELYNLAEDRSELNDLAASNPQKVAELKKMYFAWAKRTDVLPWNEARGGGKKKKKQPMKK